MFELIGAAILGCLAVYYRVRLGTRDIWRSEAEAQLTRANRLQESVDALTVQIERLREENSTLRQEIHELRNAIAAGRESR